MTSCWGDVLVTAGSTATVDEVGIGTLAIPPTVGVSNPLCGVVTIGWGMTTPGIV